MSFVCVSVVAALCCEIKSIYKPLLPLSVVNYVAVLLLSIVICRQQSFRFSAYLTVFVKPIYSPDDHLR